MAKADDWVEYLSTLGEIEGEWPSSVRLMLQGGSPLRSLDLAGAPHELSVELAFPTDWSVEALTVHLGPTQLGEVTIKPSRLPAAVHLRINPPPRPAVQPSFLADADWHARVVVD